MIIVFIITYNAVCTIYNMQTHTLALLLMHAHTDTHTIAST